MSIEIQMDKVRRELLAHFKAELYFGTFSLNETDVWGQLELNGRSTQLHLRTEQPLGRGVAPEHIHGRLHDFRRVSCIRCIGSEQSIYTTHEGMRSFSWSLRPHQVIIGNQHFDPLKDRITGVSFSTTDIHKLIDDFDSFGVIFSPSEEQSSIIPKTVGDRITPLGDEPAIAYFAGRTKILTAQLQFGKFEVITFAGPNADETGARLDSHIRFSLEFTSPVDLDDCLAKVAQLGQFLSLIAGRSQGIELVDIQVEGSEKNRWPLELHWLLGPRQSAEEKHIPDSFDMPLDAVRRTEEFIRVIQGWFESYENRAARARLYSSLQSGSYYTPDRLVASANLFDLIESKDRGAICPELETAKQECLRILRAIPRSDDRDGAIQGIARIGSLTLMKKVLSRAELLMPHFFLENIATVVKQAVLFRNYFVHGPGDSRFNYEVMNPHMIFLTETLEFVFAAAELISCGWDGKTWHSRGHTSHHWFTRYLADYPRAHSSLMTSLNT